MSRKGSGIGTSDFEVRKEIVGSKPSDGKSRRWWNLKDRELHEGVFSVVADLDAADTRRLNDNLRWARLYGNRDIAGTRPGSFTRTSTPAEPGKPARLTYNVVRSCVDAATTKIAQSRPKPLFLTEDGDAGMQSRAKWLTKYVEGVFYEGEAYPTALRSFRDAAVFGTGVLHLFWELDSRARARLRFERVLPDEILIDEEEGRYGRPSQMHRRKWVLKDRLIELFPKSENELRSARGEKSSNARTDDTDQIEVVESWHLPSSPGAKDGKHAITISGATLFSEPWTLDFFPFAFFSWSDPMLGFWGTGLADELVGIQIEINRLCRDIASALRLAAQPRVFIEHGSQVVASHLNPGAGDRIPVVRYVGREPKFQTAPAMNPEVYAERDRWIRLAYEVTGINQLNATGKKPAGLESGEAMRVYNDTASERFVTTSQRWEELFMDLARKVIDMSRCRYEAGDKTLSVLAERDKFVRHVKWSEVDLEADSYRMKVFPTNLLPTTPAGRLEKVTELINSKLLPPEQALSLLEFPDTEQFVSIETATLDNINWTISQILDEGVPGEVDEFNNLELARRLGMAHVLKAKRQGVDPSRIELLRRWVDAINDKLTPPQQETLVDPQSSLQDSPDGAPAALEGNAEGMAMSEGEGTPGPQLISDPLSKLGMTPMSGPAMGSIDKLGAGGSLDVLGSLQAHSDVATRFNTSPGAGPSGAFLGGLPLISDPDSKSPVHPAKAAPAEMMDAIGGGKTFRYKPGVPGEDPNEQQYGTTTRDLKASAMGRSMVTEDPVSGYEAIDVKESVGPLLASVGNLNERVRMLEAENAALRGGSAANDKDKETA